MEEVTDYTIVADQAITGDQLIVTFGPDNKTIAMTLEGDDEIDLMRQVLSDVNLWSNFLSSLSAAIKEHK